MNERIGGIMLVLAIVGGLALGCQAGLSDTPALDTPASHATRPPSPAYPAPEPTPPLPSGTPGADVPAEAERAVALARADLARRLGSKTEAIAVARVEAVDWPSTALGCPEPGKLYADVITPGYQVILAAEGQRYEYHTDTGTQAVLCQEGNRVGATSSPGSAGDDTSLEASDVFGCVAAISLATMTLDGL